MHIDVKKITIDASKVMLGLMLVACGGGERSDTSGATSGAKETPKAKPDIREVQPTTTEGQPNLPDQEAYFIDDDLVFPTRKPPEKIYDNGFSEKHYPPEEVEPYQDGDFLFIHPDGSSSNYSAGGRLADREREAKEKEQEKE